MQEVFVVKSSGNVAGHGDNRWHNNKIGRRWSRQRKVNQYTILCITQTKTVQSYCGEENFYNQEDLFEPASLE